MPCIEDLNYELIMESSSYHECADYITSNFKEIHYVPPGYRLFDINLIGIPPIPVGVDGEDIVFPYLKPCSGSFLLKIHGKNELHALRTDEKKIIKINGINYAVICWDGNICEKCPRKRVILEGYRLMHHLKRPNLSFKLLQLAIQYMETIRKAGQSQNMLLKRYLHKNYRDTQLE